VIHRDASEEGAISHQEAISKVVVLGCAGMGPEVARAVSDELGGRVPVIEPVECAVRACAALVAQGLSSCAAPRPAAQRLDGDLAPIFASGYRAAAPAGRADARAEGAPWHAEPTPAALASRGLEGAVEADGGRALPPMAEDPDLLSYEDYVDGDALERKLGR